MRIEGSLKGTLRRAAVYHVIRDHGLEGISRRGLGPLLFDQPGRPGKAGYRGLLPRSAWRTLDRDLERLRFMAVVFRSGKGKQVRYVSLAMVDGFKRAPSEEAPLPAREQAPSSYGPRRTTQDLPTA